MKKKIVKRNIVATLMAAILSISAATTSFADTTVNDIYNEVYGYDIPNDNISLQERILLEKDCGEKQDHYKLIQELLALQKNKVLLMKKQGLQNDLEARIDAFIKEQ